MPDLDDVIRASPVEAHPDRFAVIKARRTDSLNGFFMVCRDADETTVIAPEGNLPADDVVAEEKWFRLLAVRVSTPFGAPGFLAAISTAIAQAGINILVVSTFSKDYVLLREDE